ncbi:unnamed protein product [Pylaiella littoralis]
MSSMASLEAVSATSAAAEKHAAAAVFAADETENSSRSRRDYIAAELEDVRAMFPAPMIQAANSSFVQVVVMRTAYAKIQVRLQFPDDYPTTSTSPIVELTSASLPQPFLRKLTKSAEEAARNFTTTATETGKSKGEGGTGGRGRAVAALTVVLDAVNKNKFLPCWKELRKAATLVTSRGGEFRAEEATGLVTLRVRCGRYTVVALVRVPDRYPSEGCVVELKSHNFPAHIARRHLVQGEEIVRRCLYGYSPELALQTSNPIKMPPTKGEITAGPGNVRITSEHVRSLKHDVEYIKKAHELRDIGEGKAKGCAKVATPSTQERRGARRELKNLAKKEALSEEEQAKKLADLELKEQEELLHSQLSDTSQPSLLPLIDFLVNVFGWRLPQETCISCDKKVLPDDPRDPSLKDPAHKDRPTRVFCGHWFHHNCLRAWMTEPPFAKDCPRCKHRVYHPDWPQEPKQLEKAWANRQAKRREVGEVRDFFTVDERFQAGAAQGDDFGAFT